MTKGVAGPAPTDWWARARVAVCSTGQVTQSGEYFVSVVVLRDAWAVDVPGLNESYGRV